MRLSWPKSNDRRRALLGKSPPRVQDLTQDSNIHVVNTSFWDIEMYYYLSELALESMFLAQHHPRGGLVEILAKYYRREP
jgi:hypothetical protein